MTSVFAVALGTCFMSPASAGIVSSTPNVSFEDGTYTLNLVNGQASYSLKDSGGSGFSDNVLVKTGGTALLNETPDLFGDGPPHPSSFFTGSRAPYIGPDSGDTFTPFIAFDTYTEVPYSSTPTFLAMAFDLNDGRHYGYIKVDGPQLISYGYQTVAGQGIQAGATAVPEPASLGLFSLGLVMLGCGVIRHKRKTRA
jgi:hypothetical protein